MTTNDPTSPWVRPAPAGVDRRRALCGIAAVGMGAPLLAACGGGGSTSGTGAPTAPAAPGGEAEQDAPSAGGEVLVAVDDVPVGGAVILDGIVVTQPTAGELRGYDPTCSHQGCAVSRVEDAEIVCACHGSRFSAADGAVVRGPAPEGLEEVPVTVDGDQVVRG
ncbi:MAG: Rieske (2Fe-2S) protein [Nocardioides sp.]|nr:Rieske (2Fe-2S) protein [Nocardioides sp.]